MPAFAYRARRLDGSAVAGTLPADSEQAALATLDRMGLFPLELRPEEVRGGRAAAPTGADLRADARADRRADSGADAAAAPGRAEPWGGLDLGKLLGPRRVGAEAAARFARELADLSRAGVPILKGLDTVGREPAADDAVLWGAKESADDRRVRALLRDVRRDVAQGASLAEALGKSGELLSESAISIVRAGEEGGFLEDALRRVAVFAEREQDLARRVRGALTYPALLCLLSAAAVVFLLTWVVPRFALIYQDLGGALPWPTRVLMATGDLLRGWGPLVAVLAVAAAIAARRALLSPEVRLRRDALFLRLPLLRAVVAQACIARFGRTLGTLLASGVGILRALDIAAQAAGNGEFTRRVAQAAAPVREGAPLAQPLRATRLFPPQVVEMVEVGQESGNLAEVLEQVGDRADAEVDHSLRLLVTILEPALIVSVAGVVFFVVVAALLPVFSLNSLIQ